MNLFSMKDDYFMTHERNGRLRQSVSATPVKTRFRYENMHLADLFEYEDFAGISIPKMAPYNGRLDFSYHRYKDWKQLDYNNQCIHFFMNDEQFVTATWNRLEQTTYRLMPFSAVIAPDYSMYVDRPSFYGLQAVFRSRFVGAYWQAMGLAVIPSVSWGDVDSLTYSLIGLPMHSVLAVCGTGTQRSVEAQNLWCYAMKTIEDRLNPTSFLVYGQGVNEPQLRTPIINIEDQINKFFRQ